MIENADEKTLNQGQLGAHNELTAALWLMRQGYHVFRNLSPVGPIDLVAIKDGEPLYFDVKTSYRNADGVVMHPKLSDAQLAAGVKVLCVLPDGTCEISTRTITPGLCEECGKDFAQTRKWGQRRFCSPNCSALNYKKRSRIVPEMSLGFDPK